ncbi:hypothetical protein ACH5RR_025485 [Cinchona calisaya]|uniref:Pentatricopeptide repeat-containing protein n=1 Tax=Cinchona calisaya TaxID=153742 RepID=A0ABD2Z0W1_9GENT
MLIPVRALVSELSKTHQTLSKTKNLHAFIIKTQLSNDPFYATRLSRFYAINNELISAHQLFDKTPQRSIYLWNSIIRAYAKSHLFSDAFALFRRMLSSETKPDSFSFACLLRACSEKADLNWLRIVHGIVVVSGFGLDSICSSALVSAYSKLGRADEASRIFYGILEPDLVLWNSMISGYGCSGNWYKVLELLKRMRTMGMSPDSYTMVGLIMGLTDPSLVRIGESIHGYCLKCGFDSNDHVNSVLVSMYSRFKSLDSACKLFCCLSQPDLVTWSALITGFSQTEQHMLALDFFKKMNMESKKPDPILIASVLAASAQMAMIKPGCEIHGYAIRHGCDLDVMVSSALIDMYAKSGFLELGIQIFKNMPKKNIVSYNALISSLGLYGLATEAFQMFEEVLLEGFRPDGTTFAALLGACCHARLVDAGREYFRRMKDEFGILAETEHYVHTVKLLGMAGELKEAYELAQSLPQPADSAIWGALLTCCDTHEDYELAEIVAECLFKTKPGKSSYRVMLSNVYAGDGRWKDVQNLRADTGNLKGKIPGISWFHGMKSLKM